MLIEQCSIKLRLEGQVCRLINNFRYNFEDRRGEYEFRAGIAKA